MNASEIQAELYRLARNAGLEVRLEVRCGTQHPQTGRSRASRSCRFDAVVLKDGAWQAIVECKSAPSKRHKRTRQTTRYALHGLPVFLVQGEADLPLVLEQLLTL